MIEQDKRMLQILFSMLIASGITCIKLLITSE